MSDNFFLVINIFHREPYGPPIGPEGSNRFSMGGGGGSGALPLFLRKPIATCDFPGRSGPPIPTPSESANECSHLWLKSYKVSTWLYAFQVNCVGLFLLSMNDLTGYV